MFLNIDGMVLIKSILLRGDIYFLVLVHNSLFSDRFDYFLFVNKLYSKRLH